MMKRTLLIFLPFCTFLLLSETLPEPQRSPNLATSIPTIQTDTFDQVKALADLRAQIAGRENEPAGEVFENLKMMGKMPAARLLRVMEMGFSNSLGVTCTHCHNPENWAGEEKPTKGITRDMMAMTGRINNELLKGIENLGGEDGQATVNCTTCHRGEIVPALRVN